MSTGLNAVCVKSYSFSLVLSHLERNTGFFWGEDLCSCYVQKRQGTRSILMISAGLVLAQSNAEQCQTSLGSWDVHRWLAQWWGCAVQSSQLRPCCQEFLFIPVPAVTALALKDNNYSKPAPPFLSPEAGGLGLVFNVLVLGLVWRCPQTVNSYPRI